MRPRKFSLWCKAMCLGLAVVSSASAAPRHRLTPPIDQQLGRSYDYLINNLQNKSAAPGAVIASPSRSRPNYFFHWVRDAGLSMNAIVTAYERSQRPDLKVFLQRLIKDWIAFEIRLQHTPNRSGGLGEPFFLVDGSANPNDWGRPQNDGAAIRAITMIRYAKILLAQGDGNAAGELYRPELPANSPIKMDLEYVAHHWNEPSFDLWEEVKGQNFFTLMAQRKALLDGAELAAQLGDPAAGQYYLSQAHAIEASLQDHRNANLQLIDPTIRQVDGWTHKRSHQDAAVLLGALYFSRNDGFFGPTDSFLLSSAMKLEDSFRALYAINQDASKKAIIGRYPEDVYSGFDMSTGNGWFLTTHIFAELYCSVARALERQPSIRFTPALTKFLSRIAPAKNPKTRLPAPSVRDPRLGPSPDQIRGAGMDYLERALSFAGADGRMSEQINRDSGRMQGASDLTWSYASFVRAAETCSQ